MIFDRRTDDPCLFLPALFRLLCFCIAPRILLIENMASAGRLAKELKEVGKDDSSGVKATPLSDGNMNHLKATVQGPAGTPYEGGVFAVDIQIPKQYPFEPPKMKFLTKVWHPNISSQTGAICLVGCCLFVVFPVVVVWHIPDPQDAADGGDGNLRYLHRSMNLNYLSLALLTRPHRIF